jgi:putative ABC transport system permease protein
MFMTGLNVAAAWDRNLADPFATRRYDLEIRLSRPEATDTLLRRLSSIPGVQKAEARGYAPIAPARPGEIDIAQTYPDKGHGSFSLFAPPSATTLVNFPILSGRWLRPGDSDAVVLNQTALARFPGAAPGDIISFQLTGARQHGVWWV